MSVEPTFVRLTPAPLTVPTTTPAVHDLGVSTSPFVLLAFLVMFRTTVYAWAVISGHWTPRIGALHPTWLQLTEGLLYAVTAAVLIVLGRRDPRAWSLGVFLGGFACALMDPFVSAASPLVTAAMGLRTDAFFCASLWYFCAAFPFAARRSRLWVTFAGGVATTLLLGVVLVALDAIQTFALPVPNGLRALAGHAARHSTGSADWFFSLQFLTMLPLLVLMPLKARDAGADERRRFRWLTAGIVLALGPLTIDVFAVTFWPGFHEATRGTVVWALRSAGIMIGLGVLPLASAYSALVHRAVDIGFAFRSAAQYLVARYAVLGMVAAPIAAALVVVVINRDRSLADLATSTTGFSLAAMTAITLAALAGRHRLLHLIDMRFFREEVDAQSTFLSLVDDLERAASIEALAATAEAAIDAAFHPSTTAICVEDSHGQLVAQNVELPALATNSALAQIAGGDGRPLVVEEIPPAVLTRLPDADRDWLARSRAAVLVPLRSSPRELAGLVAVGERRSELPYRDGDLRLLAALGSACGLAIDRLRRAPVPGSGRIQPVDPARECVECGEVFEGDAIACRCGAPLKRAPVPRELNGRLRLLRRVGAGGFAVVYQAVDLSLKQPRAVKTLPVAEPAHFARLRREARLMSAVHHPHLATVFALETWGLSPLLVMEFLDGGTLGDRLRRGPLALGDVVTLGRQVGSAMAALHDAGVLHRDIKPSNIGFSADATPKLLDFGLARMMDVQGAQVAATAGDSTWSGLPHSELSGGFRGTPAYASPEALMGAPPSPADDVWSLGVTLLEAVTGVNAFKAATPAAVAARVLADDGRLQQWVDTVPPGARDLFRKLLSRVPSERITSSRAVIELLAVHTVVETARSQE